MPASKVFPGVFPGTVTVPVDPVALFERADVVLRGEVGSVVTEAVADYLLSDRTVSFEERVAALFPQRLYKGAAGAPEVRVHFLHPPFPSSMTDFSTGEHALLFLRGREGRLELADSTAAKVGLSRGEAAPSADLGHPLASLLVDLESRLTPGDAPLLTAAVGRLAKRADGEAVAILQALAQCGGALLRDPARRALEALKPVRDSRRGLFQ